MLDTAIEEIIKKIPCGAIFDSHAIIEYLLQNYSDVYLSSFIGGSTLAYNGIIGNKIESFCSPAKGALLAKVGDSSWSMNIRKNFSTCACWKRIK
ncbi:hypothetical protein [Treponema endosymbiont of Eucomonympha sp.]|uniref:hypothetical protein n=1 Tax=Treponema endosymbiont of Eucomonympha sp. TaxID=1580831 RepID=UPI0007515390|nr:hypothetical protein [Treponema endosymbiont of Eucomonympha sp.]